MRPCSGPWGDQSLARGRGWAGKGKEADGKGRDMGIVGTVRVCRGEAGGEAQEGSWEGAA